MSPVALPLATSPVLSIYIFKSKLEFSSQVNATH